MCGRIEYWSGRGHLFVTDKSNAAKFTYNDAIAHAQWFNGFTEAS